MQSLDDVLRLKERAERSADNAAALELYVPKKETLTQRAFPFLAARAQKRPLGRTATMGSGRDIETSCNEATTPLMLLESTTLAVSAAA